MRPSLNKIFVWGTAVLAGYFFYTCAAGQSNFFTRHVDHQRGRAKARIQITQLNYLIPSFAPLAAFGQGQGAARSIDWDRYVDYYEKVAELMPRRSDVYVFLGYCYFYRGQKEQAIVSFEKAVLLDPRSFWAYYNIAVMTAQDGNCQTAAAAFGRAMDVPVQETAKLMYTSKLYTDLGLGGANPAQFIEQHLKAAYLNAYQLGASAARCGQGAADLRTLALNARVQIF